MQFIKTGTNIDFVGKRGFAIVLSSIMLVMSLTSIMVHHGLNYGIDFAGGTLIHVAFKSPTSINQIRSRLLSTELEASTVQEFGVSEKNEFLIKISQVITETDLSEKVKDAFATDDSPNINVRRVEIVGPQIGKELREKALFAIFYALLLISIYISGRFEFKWALSCFVVLFLTVIVYLLSFLKIPVSILIFLAVIFSLSIFGFVKLRYALGAIIALIHDVVIIIGVFSILNKEFSLPVVASLLTIVGYSLNDTIVVFDRIRENLKKYPAKQFSIVVNQSINETLGRTVLTSVTTLMVVITLVVYGGVIIHDFAFALMIGIIAGTYSSIYVASPVLLAFQKRKNMNKKL